MTICHTPLLNSILLQFQFNCNWAELDNEVGIKFQGIIPPSLHHHTITDWDTQWSGREERGLTAQLSNNPIFAEFQAIIQPFSTEVFCNPILSNYVGFYISVVIKTQLMSNINTSSFSPWNVFEISITLLKSFLYIRKLYCKKVISFYTAYYSVLLGDNHRTFPPEHQTWSGQYFYIPFPPPYRWRNTTWTCSGTSEAQSWTPEAKYLSARQL